MAGTGDVRFVARYRIDGRERGDGRFARGERGDRREADLPVEAERRDRIGRMRVRDGLDDGGASFGQIGEVHC